MKKFIVLFSLIISYSTIFGQNNRVLSIESGFSYYYHFMGGATNNNFNYGFSLLLSHTVGKVKVSTGIDYSTKFYYYTVSEVQPANHLLKRNFRIQYLDFPFLANTSVLHIKQFNMSILSGLVLNKVLHYKIVSYYSGIPPFEEEPKIPKTFGLSLRIGATLSMFVKNHVILNIVPFTDVKLVLNGNDDSPNYNEGIPDNRFSLGLKIGVEYAFK